MPSLTVQLYPNTRGDLSIVESVIDAGIDLEFIIIEENGTNQSEAIIDLRKRYGSRITVVKGSGDFISNFSHSLQLSSGDFVAVLRSGLAFNPTLLVEMMEKAEEGYDLVIASRFTSADGKKLSGDLKTKLIHLMVREMASVKDPLSGMYLVRREKIPDVAMCTGVDTVLSELILKVPGLKIAEVPAESAIAHHSKFGYRNFIPYSFNILKLSRYRALKYASVGVSGMLVNFGILYLLSNFLRNPLSSDAILISPIAGFVAIQTSIVTNFLLNNAWTFKDRAAESALKRFSKFELFAWTGASVNLVTLTVGSIYMYYMLANLIGVCLGFLVNYFSSDLLVWKTAKRVE